MGRRVGPAGYETFATADGHVVTLSRTADAVRRALCAEDGSARTLYAYAEEHTSKRSLMGRGVAYAVPLPDGTPVVVRHSRHGGLLAPLTGDLFVGRTRAPLELATALRLRDSGVVTPELVCYIVYPVGPLLRRVDVATREIEGGWDLADALAAPADAGTRRRFLDAAAILLGALAAAGARHPDLNLKNVLLAPAASGRVVAHVLDVDRIVFGRPGDAGIGRANFERFARSARKLRAAGRLGIDERELMAVARAAGLRL